MKQTLIFSGGIQWNIEMANFWDGGTPLLKVNEKSPLLTKIIKYFCMECILLHRVHNYLPLIKPVVISISTFLENMHLHEIIPEKCHYTAIHSSCT
jgi:hypothetical protein